MRDVSFKSTTLRVARARALLTVSPATVDIIRRAEVPKGNPLEVAKVAAVIAAKKTTEWIPYCHNIPIEHVTVEFELTDTLITVDVAVTSVAKTGVEMEALTAATAAVLNLYDMLKMLDEEMEISSIRLIDKKGGKSDLAVVQGWRGAVLTASDRASAGTYEDISGNILEDGLLLHGATEVLRSIVADDVEPIRDQTRHWINEGVDIVVVTGGTGIGPRDVTPEALSPLVDKQLPGIAQALAHYSQDRIRTAMFSRAVAGLAGQTLLLAVPGAPSACKDALAALFPAILHVVRMVGGGQHE